MPPTTSVVVLDPNVRGLVELVHSLDAQTVAPHDFEVIFAGTLAAAVGDRLAELVPRRPNVTVIDGPLAAGVSAAAGRWLLVLPPALCAAGVQLQPEGIARLAEFATEHDPDAVLARIDVAAGSRACDLLVRDTPRLDAVPATALDPGLVLYRTEFARTHGAGSEPDEIAAVLAGAQVAAFGAYPAARVAGKPVSDAAAPKLERVAAEWRDGAAVITASGTVRPGADDRSAVLSVRRNQDCLEYWIAGEGPVDSAGRFSLSVTLDPHTAALGGALAPGLWEFRVGVHGRDGTWSPRTALPASPLEPAILRGLLVAVDGNARSLVFDVGATRASVVGKLAAERVEIAESARGTLLTAQLDQVAVTGTSRTTGHVLLGKFALPATLEADAGRAQLSCFLSGLAGTSTVATRFGGRAVPTGLDLTIDGVGLMTLAPTPPAPAAKDAPSLVGRLRRAVPPRLEPAVARLSHNPTARRLYRRLTGPRPQR